VTGRTSGPYKPVPLLCIVFLLEQAEEKRQEKPEAKDVLPNINRTPPAERAEKCCFLSLVTLTFKLVRARVGWGLTALLTQNRSYRACKFVGIFHSKL